MDRDKFTCQSCFNTKETLNVHHIKYTAKEIWNEPSENLITVCETCHNIYTKIKDEYGCIGEFRLKVLDLYSGADDFNYFVFCHRDLYFVQKYDEGLTKLIIHFFSEMPGLRKIINFMNTNESWH